MAENGAFRPCCLSPVRDGLAEKRCADNGLAGLARHCLYLAFTPFHLHSRKTGGSASERQSPMRGSLPSRRSMKLADPLPLLAIRAPEACRMIGIGRTKLYELIHAGDLETVKLGRGRLITVSSLRRLIVTKKTPSGSYCGNTSSTA